MGHNPTLGKQTPAYTRGDVVRGVDAYHPR
jgi:hypothetical protein